MKILVDENDFGNAVCKTAAILSQPQCVNDTRIYIIKNVPDEAVAASPVTLNTLRTRQNGRHFPDDIFKRIFSNENAWISLKISLKFVPKVPINNIPALV